MTASAIGLLVDVGIAGTTLAAIGERAGYSRGLATHRFGSKARLLAHVHDTVASDWIRRVQAAVGDRVGVEALEHVVDALCGFIEDEPDELRAMYLLRYASIDPASEYRANVAKVHKAQCRDARRWIEEGQKAGGISPKVNAELAAELFCATADGLLYRWLVNPRLPVAALHRALRREVRRSLSLA
ncbi:MAG: TetR/AcrR family transcriptional regulator [Nevskia sp.]|nr:TetR/AcrR family transcriptional regulator [Nevskia sp.]